MTSGIKPSYVVFRAPLQRGSQAEDAQVLHWTFRLNLYKQKLENLIIKDRWSSNQETIDGSMEAFFIDDVKTGLTIQALKITWIVSTY